MFLQVVDAQLLITVNQSRSLWSGPRVKTDSSYRKMDKR